MNRANWYYLCLFLIVVNLCLQCAKSKKFKLSKAKVGYLNSKTKIGELDRIFKNDSLVKHLSEGALGNNYFEDDDAYLVYEKGGKHLLTITPNDPLDSSSTIKRVEIFDDRFVTKKGISLNSNYSQIKANCNISKIESSLLSATLFIDALNATMTIDKEELGLKNFSIQKISPDQVPDLAKIKSFVIWFR